MRKDGVVTRGRILDAAHILMLKYGYGGMSIDDVIAKAGITKGALFYHFKGKEDLARALLQRYAEQDRTQLEEMLQRAEKLSGDPLQQLLLLIGLRIEFLQNDSRRDGCLYASYCYQSGLLEASTLRPARDMILHWREKFESRIREALRVHNPRIPVDPQALADQVLVTLEGAFVLSKTLNDFKIMAQQFEQLRATFALIFAKENEVAGSGRTAVY